MNSDVTGSPPEGNSEEDRKHLILIVDDNPTNLAVIVEYLEQSGFKILVARNGEFGLKRAKFAHPDLILLDVMMPGIDGFETCRLLKEDETTKEIPVIFMTALSSIEDKVKGFDAGGVDYITKPIQHEEVLARVTTHLRIRDLTLALRENQAKLEASYQREQKRRQLSDTLREVAKVVSSTLNPDRVLDLTLTHLEQVILFDYSSVTLLSGDNQLSLVAARAGGKTENLSNRIIVPLDRYPLNVDTLRDKRPVLLQDVTTDDRWEASGRMAECRSFINAPLLVQDRPIGLLSVGRNDEIPYTVDDSQTVFAFALQVAIALENSRLVEQIQGFNEELKKLNADKDKFFSIVAHDLKGPFMPLLGNAELLLEMFEHLSSEDIKDISRDIHRSAKHVLNLLENLLSWARLQMGRMEYHPDEIDLYTIVEQSVDLLSASAETKQITLHSTVTPGIVVHADEHMIDTVIRNLTNNALKFTPADGQIMIGAKQQSNEEYDFIEVSVTDTGVGISQEDVDKLFRIDVHHSTTGTAQEGGTGLGLIMCKEMVEMNNGQIWVESVLGQGSTFKFTIPLSGSKIKKPIADTTIKQAEVTRTTHVTDIISQPPIAESMSSVEIVKMSDSVNRSAKAIYDLLDELLNWAKTEVKEMTFAPADFDLKPFLERNIDDLNMEIQQKNVDLQNKLTESLPVHADQNMLDIVIRGLILNAFKFTPVGGAVTISANQYTPLGEPLVQISVSDNGNGIRPKPFKLKHPTSGEANIGLGLVMYQEIIKRNGGQIWVDSETGKGTTVNFTVPALN
jgi:signal transduction histidine kinase/FixJ family two-component response regulator